MSITKFSVADYTLDFSKEYDKLIVRQRMTFQENVFDLTGEKCLKIFISGTNFCIRHENPPKADKKFYKQSIHPQKCTQPGEALGFIVNPTDGIVDKMGGLGIIDLRDSGRNEPQMARIIYYLKVAPVYLKNLISGATPFRIVSPGPKGGAFISDNTAKAS